jgi:hypothetical protein
LDKPVKIIFILYTKNSSFRFSPVGIIPGFRSCGEEVVRSRFFTNFFKHWGSLALFGWGVWLTTSNRNILAFFKCITECQICDLFEQMIFFEIFRSFLHIKPKLCRKNELGYEQDLSMLFSNHTCFLLICNFSLNGGWHAEMEKLKNTFFKRCFSACQIKVQNKTFSFS